MIEMIVFSLGLLGGFALGVYTMLISERKGDREE